MRVSSYSKFDSTQFYMNSIQGKTVRQQYQIATGKYFEHASEDPIRANQVSIIKNSISRIDQYQKNITDADGFLKTAESTIGTAVNLMHSVREEGLKASNGTASELDKETFADTIDEMVNQMVTLANTKYLGKYLFSGERTDQKAFEYDGATATYQGDNVAPEMKISSNVVVKVTEVGSKIFQDVFDAMINLRDQIRTGNTSDVENALSQLDMSSDVITQVRSELGIKMKTVTMMGEGYETEKLNLDTKRTNVEEVDFTKLMMEYATTQQVHKATIASMQKMYSVSLLDYI